MESNMEPDFDKLSLKKIRQAELRITPWNKESVWQNVMKETRGRRHNHYFHYAAAAAVLFSIFFGVLEVQNEIEPQLTELSNRSDQQSNNSQKKSVVPGSKENSVHDKIDAPTETNKTLRAMKIRQHLSNDISSVKPEEQLTKIKNEPIVKDLDFSEDEFLLPDDVTIHEEKIRPIVGVITEVYSGEVVKAKRKKSLHKLESVEPVPWESVPKALVFARKK